MDHAQRNGVMCITLSATRGRVIWITLRGASPDVATTEPQA
jgi:hypothetical protein